MLEIIIDKDSCTGCAFCALVCPTNCLWLDYDAMKATITDIGACIVCRNCEDNCPKKIIEVRLMD